MVEAPKPHANAAHVVARMPQRRRRLDNGEVAELEQIICRATRAITAGVRPHDFDDVRQELWLRVLGRLLAFNPARGNLAAYATVVIRGLVVDLIRERMATKRCDESVASLDWLVAGEHGEPEPLATRVDHRRLTARLGRAPCCATCDVDLRDDIRHVAADADEATRELARLAMQFSVAEVARVSGLPRSTVRGRLRALQQHCRAGHMDGYLNRRRRAAGVPGGS